MAKHNVHVNLPWRELGHSDVVFTIYEDGEKFGTITISKGAIEWYPGKAKKPYSLLWPQFDKMIKKHFGHL